jgi:hypothetical protein
MPDTQDITVNTPEGDKLHFPLGTDQQTIVSAMGKLKMQKASASPQQTPSVTQPPPMQGPSGPTSIGPQPSTLSRTLAASGVTNLNASDLLNPVSMMSKIHPIDAINAATKPLESIGAKVPGTGTTVGQAVSNAKDFTNIAGNTAAALATPETLGPLASQIPFLKWLTASKTAGARALQEASMKAGNAPIELSAKTNEIVDKIVQQGKLGGTIPKVVTDLLDRVGPSTRIAAEAKPGPLTYDEARILQSNTSSLSAAEQMSLKGQLKSLIPQLARSLAEDVQAGATQAGIGQEHAFGMQQYAQASARNRALLKAGKAVAGAAGAGAAYELTKKVVGK